MKKIFKRTIQFLLILLVLILAALIIIPIAFKPQLMNAVKKEINKSVNANVDFDFQVSLIKGFPDLYVGLKNLRVVGVDTFSLDTLVAFDEFSVKVDVKSVFGMKNIVVKSILLDKPRMMAHVLPDGRVNWDIMKPSTDTVTVEEPVDTAAGKPITMKVALRKFEIRDADIKYQDDSSNMSATISNLDFVLSGNMGLDYTDLQINTSIEALNFAMEGMKYLKDAQLGFKGEIGADIVNSVYTFKDNEFNLNAISLKFAGAVKMPAEDIDIDLTFGTNKTDFKSLLSLVPAIYMQDFEGLKTSGKLKLDGFAKGIYNDKTMPNAHLELIVENAMFQYPDLPKSANNININTKVDFDGTNMDNTTVDVNQFHVELAGNPFDAQVHVKTPMSDMQVGGLFKGKVDFTSLADVVPLDSMTIKGFLESNIEFGGKMSYIEKEQYDQFKANGSIRLSNFEFISNDLPQGLKINETVMNFSPQYVDLQNFESQIGRSDLKMNGRLENFIPYVFKDETIKGKLNIYSSLLDANEFLTGEETPEDTIPEDTSAMSVIEIPKNIDFALSTDIKHIYYDKLDISNLNGGIIVNRGKATMKNLSMNLLDGSLVLNGEYSTEDVQKPSVAFDMNIKDFDIPSTFKSFSSLEKIAPKAKDLIGKISTQFTMTSLLDSTMSPVMNSINAKGKLQSKDIMMKDSKVFGKVADLLKNESYRNPSLKDVNLSFTIKDGKVSIDPFDTKLSDLKMNIGGDLGLDQSLNFKAKMAVPQSKLGPASSLISSLTSQAAAKGLTIKTSDEVKLNLKILGTAIDPDVKIDWGAGEGAGEGIKDTVKESVKEKVDEVKTEAKQKAKEEADKLIADAQKEADRLNAEAQVLAEKIRKEAEENAKKVESEGKKKGPIAEQAAKVTAKEIRKKGEASAKKVISEADAKGKAIIEKAKTEAAKLE